MRRSYARRRCLSPRSQFLYNGPYSTPCYPYHGFGYTPESFMGHFEYPQAMYRDTLALGRPPGANVSNPGSVPFRVAEANRLRQMGAQYAGPQIAPIQSRSPQIAPIQSRPPQIAPIQSRPPQIAPPRPGIAGAAIRRAQLPFVTTRNEPVEMTARSTEEPAPILPSGDPFTPTYYSLKEWTYDPIFINSINIPRDGMAQFSAIRRILDGYVKKIVLRVVGSFGEVKKAYAGIYNATGDLVIATDNVAPLLEESGQAMLPLVSPKFLPAGDYYIGILINGDDPPHLAAQVSTSDPNIGLADMRSRSEREGCDLTYLPRKMSFTHDPVPYIWVGLA